MIQHGSRYVVMGLLDPQSIAFAIGETLRALGAEVVYSMQNEVLRKRYLDSSRDLTPEQRAALQIRYCDVSREEEVAALFAAAGPLAGVVHSMAYANPKTCMGPEFHTNATDDILRSYQVSCLSLATVTRHALPALRGGGSVVALSFESRRAFARYNWMGVHKAALEALVRALARRHGRDAVRVNAVSAGPLETTAISKIPGADQFFTIWQESSPLPWDPVADKKSVADAVAFLLSPLARKITGQVLYVDGGASIVGGRLAEDERPILAE